MNTEQYLINSSFKDISDLSEKVRHFLSKNSLNDEIINALDMCLVEALNNVVEHSYKMEDGNKIELQLELYPQKVILILSDWGISRTNFKKAKLEFDPDDIESLPEGGMGLFIIEQLMDTTDYRSLAGKNIFTMEKYY